MRNRKIGAALGSSIDDAILKDLRKRGGSRRYDQALELNDKGLKLISIFSFAIQDHINKKVGLAFGKGTMIHDTFW